MGGGGGGFGSAQDGVVCKVDQPVFLARFLLGAKISAHLPTQESPLPPFGLLQAGQGFGV